jgi:hypothetical protein
MIRETKFNAGDKVKFVKEIYDCTKNEFTIGKYYTIKYIDNFGTNYVDNDNGNEWCIAEGAFQKKKNNLIKETDFLDAFKENFMDGG